MPQGRDGTVLRRASLALDATNFFLADVRQGLGPYLAVYLLTDAGVNPARLQETTPPASAIRSGKTGSSWRRRDDDAA